MRGTESAYHSIYAVGQQLTAVGVRVRIAIAQSNNLDGPQHPADVILRHRIRQHCSCVCSAGITVRVPNELHLDRDARVGLDEFVAPSLDLGNLPRRWHAWQLNVAWLRGRSERPRERRQVERVENTGQQADERVSEQTRRIHGHTAGRCACS